MRILALDVGAKRIGLALSDEFGWTAQPLPVITVTGRGEVLATLSRLVAEREVAVVVVGLPLNMNGSESRQTETVRRFAERLRGALPHSVRIEMWDERLTSRQSERTMGALGLRRLGRKERSDQIAAQLILQGYLERTRSERRSPSATP